MQAKNIAIGLMGILLLQSFFSFFRLSLFVNFTENTLANLRLALYSNLVKLPMSFFSQKRVGELNSRISSDITQIQDTLTSTIAEFLRQFILIIGGALGILSRQILNYQRKSEKSLFLSSLLTAIWFRFCVVMVEPPIGIAYLMDLFLIFGGLFAFRLVALARRSGSVGI